MNRAEILEKASQIVTGHREQEYGSPEDNFERIAKLWAVYLETEINAADVAAMMILLKIARLIGGNGTEDTWIDIAGYAGCGGEIDGH